MTRPKHNPDEPGERQQQQKDGQQDEQETRHDSEALDEALNETFPSSDPIAVSITKETLGGTAARPTGQR